MSYSVEFVASPAIGNGIKLNSRDARESFCDRLLAHIGTRNPHLIGQVVKKGMLGNGSHRVLPYYLDEVVGLCHIVYRVMGGMVVIYIVRRA